MTFLFYAIKTKLGKQTREKFKIGSNDVSPSFPGKQKVVPTAKKRYFINGGFQSTFKYYQIKFWKQNKRKQEKPMPSICSACLTNSHESTSDTASKI